MLNSSIHEIIEVDVDVLALVKALISVIGDFMCQAEVEVDRLQLLKISKMKEIVLKKRLELEEVCRNAHLEPDVNTSEDRLVALIESGMVDAADLLTSLEAEISRAKEEVASRKDIMSLMEKWMSACEEEAWLEDYNKVRRSYSCESTITVTLLKPPNCHTM